MKLLLDLSVSKIARVALVHNGQIVQEKTGTDPILLIDELLKSQHLILSDLEEADAVPGPGSFTGLKVGAAIANAINYSLGKKKRIKLIYEAKTSKLSS